MKANVLAYLTNGNVVRMHVQHPEVGPCENGTHVGIFDHCCYRCAVDDYDDWYEGNNKFTLAIDTENPVDLKIQEISRCDFEFANLQDRQEERLREKAKNLGIT